MLAGSWSARSAGVRSAAALLTGARWRYLKVPQQLFEQLQAATLSDLVLSCG